MQSSHLRKAHTRRHTQLQATQKTFHETHPCEITEVFDLFDLTIYHTHSKQDRLSHTKMQTHTLAHTQTLLITHKLSHTNTRKIENK